jgi:hypothetical protein
MSVLKEGNLEITIPNATGYRKFDDPTTHGLSCMKAVDFIVEMSDHLLFIEIKDPEDPLATSEDRRTQFIEDLKSGKIDDALKYKYRDSFLYEWASGRVTNKPIFYYVIIAIKNLSAADLLHRTDELKRKLPLHGPDSGEWKQAIVNGCAVFNINSWNKKFPKYVVQRMKP